MDKMQQAAFVSVGRAVAFTGFGILTVMVGLSYDPVLAFRSGGLMLLLLLAALLLKAQRTRETNYRHTEVWVLLDESDRPDDRFAGAAVKVAVREVCLRFARWTAGVAVVIWAGAFLMALLGLGGSAHTPEVPFFLAGGLFAHARRPEAPSSNLVGSLETGMN